jgi:hypothetical protein
MRCIDTTGTGVFRVEYARRHIVIVIVICIVDFLDVSTGMRVGGSIDEDGRRHILFLPLAFFVVIVIDGREEPDIGWAKLGLGFAMVRVGVRVVWGV